jgi:hypothetical protein
MRRAGWGQFATTTSNYAYLDAALTYTTNDVLLRLKRKTTSGGNTGGAIPVVAIPVAAPSALPMAETGNQRQAAQGIESLPSTHALYKYVETLPAGTPAAAFNSLSGDTHATVGGSLVGLGALHRASAASTCATTDGRHARRRPGGAKRWRLAGIGLAVVQGPARLGRGGGPLAAL